MLNSLNLLFMTNNTKRVNIAFGIVLLFVGLVFIFIAVNFSLKGARLWRYSQKSTPQEVVFSVKEVAKGGFYILAEYKIGEAKHSEPLEMSARTRYFESREIANLFLVDAKQRSWSVFSSFDGKTTINKPIMPVKEGMYLLMCLGLMVYFLVLRTKVIKALDTAL
jgi:hypothetical protein